MAEGTAGDAAPRGGRTRRGTISREHILDTALRVFRARGYEKATMRAIAEEAGTSLGAAYYYFRSKEELIQGFYARTHDEHLAACGRLLDEETRFQPRVAGVLRARIGSSMPYHRFAGALFRTAADPASPLSPFSPASQPTRRAATELFARVVAGSDARPHARLEPLLPDLLWLYEMGVILFWIHDASPGCRRTYVLIEHTSALVARLVELSRLPPLAPLVQRTVNLVEALGGAAGPGAA